MQTRTAPRVLRREPPRPVLAIAGTGPAEARSAEAEPVLDADDIQGNIVPGFNTAQMLLLGLRIRPGEEPLARRWLRDLTPLITSLNDAFEAREVRRAVAKATGIAPPRPTVFLNVALSFDALAPLQLSSASIPAGPYQRGMAYANLNDPVDDRGVPIGWKVGATAETTPHVLLIAGADSPEALDEARQTLIDHTGPGSGLDVMYEERGARLDGDTEFFGFRDGISQPGVRGRRTPHPESFVTRRYFAPGDPLGERFARPGQPLIWPGQFIYGYPTQDLFEGPGPIAMPPAPWMKNGSFLVFRRLRQDVAAFEEFATRQAGELTRHLGRTVTAAEVKAWLVGRWPKGDPLLRAPDAPPPQPGNDFEQNHFDYASASPDASVVTTDVATAVAGVAADEAGYRCPHFAHVRKVNLRDKLTDRGPSANFRLLRRGIPYDVPGTEDRGLLFLSYQRDLEQFMAVMVNWVNGGSAPEGASGHDLLLGQGPTLTAVRSFADGTSAPLDATSGRRWIVPTGGGFFFAPARSVFAGLAD